MGIIDFRMRPLYGGYLSMARQGTTEKFLTGLRCKITPSIRECSVELMVEEMDQAGIEKAVLPGRQSPGTFVENRELRAMYEVICQCFEGFRENSPFPGWYVDTFARIKKAESYLCGLRRDGKLVSVAGVYNVSPVSAMISSVATLPGYRGQGLARQCIRRCLEYVRYLDCTPYLTAAEPSLVEYYKGLGFTPCAERCSAVYITH